MVLYFSGTGNSRHVAKVIADTTGDEIVSIGERIKFHDHSPVYSDKPFVFAGPVYAGRFPRVMEKYIDTVTFAGSKKAYFIATCAQTPWLTVKYVERLCERKSFSMLGFNSVVMPQGYIAGGGTQPKDVNDEILSKAEPEIQKIADKIAAGEKLETQKPGSGMMSDILNPIMYSFMISAKKFYVNGKCTGCGKCAERCPLNNIKTASGKPIWGNECTHCMACISGCPNEAIEYGKKSVGKYRYFFDEE